MGWTFRESNCG